MLKHAMLSTTTTTSSGTPTAMLNGVHPRADGIVVLTEPPRLVLGRGPAPPPQRPPLNVSTLSASKHSLGGNSSSVSPGTAPKMANGGLHIPRARAAAAALPAAASRFMSRSKEAGVREMLTSLGLLCLVSLLLALLSLIFLLKISPLTEARGAALVTADEYVVVYEVTLALCALALSLNLCCVLVCAVQFLFAVKLVKSPHGGERTNKYLQKSSVTRVCAVGGFFVSIPVFLTGIILYTFIQFHSTPAIVTSVFIGLGIIFCGCAMVHNVFVWQREKTNAVRAMAQQQHHHHHHAPQQQHHVVRQPTPPTPTDKCHPREASGSVSPAMPPATLDLSSVTTATSPHELSTLV